MGVAGQRGAASVGKRRSRRLPGLLARRGSAGRHETLARPFSACQLHSRKNQVPSRRHSRTGSLASPARGSQWLTTREDRRTRTPRPRPSQKWLGASIGGPALWYSPELLPWNRSNDCEQSAGATPRLGRRAQALASGSWLVVRLATATKEMPSKLPLAALPSPRLCPPHTRPAVPLSPCGD